MTAAPASSDSPAASGPQGALPPRYTVCTLCFLFDARGRVLLLERSRPPNRGLFSPVGGKLETAIGESPAACASREIHEEAGIHVGPENLRLAAIVSEADFPGVGHMLMFLYEATQPVEVPEQTIDEGRLSWHDLAELPGLNLPETDRQVIWPLFLAHRGGFFAAHIDLSGESLRWRVEQGGVTDPPSLESLCGA